ncbi:MAG: SpoIIE family protein phosphatase [Symploca sp. SIO1A3]|nr:SpoIIE family protein phosphatase [Symploca sp. SIO1A3]
MSESSSLPEGELEELVESIEISSPPQVLQPGTLVTSPEGTSFPIISLVKSTSQVNIYEAIAGEESQNVCLYQAFSNTEAGKRLKQEALVSKGLDCPMFPCLIADFEREEITYLVRSAFNETKTLAEVLSEPHSLAEILPILTQVASALSQLHSHGWVHLFLRPTHIVLDKPIKILDLSQATPVGEKPSRPFSVPGYSPPDLNTEEPVDARIDIYAVGALLYQAVTGKKIPETGVELSMLPAIAGVRQILRHCLGSREERYPNIKALHQDLLRLQRRLQPQVNYGFATASSIGLDPSRLTNQDAYGYLTGQCIAESGTQAWAVACLADGMGGMAAGEVASETAIDKVLAKVAQSLTQEDEITAQTQVQWVKQWVQAANEAVYTAMEKRKVKGGCTLICACVVNRRLTIAHVGDSRLYLLRNGNAELLTYDHSLPMALVMQGEISLEEVRNHPDRSKVLRSLGDRQPMPDYYIDGLEKMTKKTVMELQSDDILLLCSDGLWEQVLEEEMCQVLSQALDLNAAATELLRIALERDTDALDNTTIVLLRLQETLVPITGKAE